MPLDMTVASLALLSLVAVIIVVMTTTRRVNYTPDGRDQNRRRAKGQSQQANKDIVSRN